MNVGAFRAFLLVAAVGVFGSCSDPLDPEPVQGPSPFLVQTTGVWGGTANLVGASSQFASNLGCFGTDVTGRIVSGVLPQDTVALSFVQDGTEVNARYISTGTGLACNYTGTASLNTVVADAAGCAAPNLVLRCDTGGVVSLVPVSSTLFATFTGGTIAATVTNAYTETGGAGGDASIVLRYSVNANRQ